MASKTMQAIGLTEYGGSEVLQMLEVPKPVAEPRDVLVQVKAFAVNPVDAKVRSGGGRQGPVPDPPLIVGWDAAGVVVAKGPEASRFEIGDEVFFAGDITRPGCYAEYVAVDDRIVGKKPANLSFAEAAAIPLTALAAWEGYAENLRAPFNVVDQEITTLVVGGGGGVGSIAIQIAKQVCGLRVVATASREESRAFCKEVGADHVIDHTKSIPDQTQALGLRGYDYIFTTGELSNFGQLCQVLNPLGKICAILAGEAASHLDVRPLFPKRGTLTFELMFTRPQLGIEPEKQGMILDQIAGLLDAGTLRSTMTQAMDWSEFRTAHDQIESGRTVGKIVLTIPEV